VSRQEITKSNILKYVNYALDKKSFLPDFWTDILPSAEDAASIARNPEFRPAILLHGILPRSGTVYVGELLRLHPQLFAYPEDIWELPFLQQAGRVIEIQRNFLNTYEQNKRKIGEHDFLPLFGSSLIGYLHQNVPSGKQLLMKVPSVQFLSKFYHMFPFENLLIVVRDGRDVVHSTLKTWPQLRFWMVCMRWRRAAAMVVACEKVFQEQNRSFLSIRFEDAVKQPSEIARRVFEKFDLDVRDFPYDRVDALSVRGASSLHSVGRVSWNPLERPPEFDPIGHWQSWGPVRKWLFKVIANKELVALGYESGRGW